MTTEQIKERAQYFEQLSLKVLEWAKERDLLHFQYAPKQALKVLEELGEYAGAINKNNPENQIKEFGDVLVTIIVLCGQCIENTKDMRFGFSYIYVQHVETLEMYEGIENCLLSLHGTIQDIKINNHFLYKNVWQNVEYALGYARANEIDAIHCLQTAYDSIKDRKGKMINGVFVKEADLQDAELKISIQELKSNLDKLQNEPKESNEYALLCETIKQAKQDLTTLQEKERSVLSQLVAEASNGNETSYKGFESSLNE